MPEELLVSLAREAQAASETQRLALSTECQNSVFITLLEDKTMQREHLDLSDGDNYFMQCNKLTW